MKSVALLCAAVSCLVACNAPEAEVVSEPQSYVSSKFERPDIRISEIALPKGYERVEAGQDSFASFMRSLALRPQGAKVRSCTGVIQEDQSAVSAVVFHPIPINGTLTAADVPVCLYAEYLFSEGREDEISFKLPGGFDAKYSAWRDGERFKADGDAPVMDCSVPADSTIATFVKFLDKVYGFTSSSSIPSMFSKVSDDDVRIGDIAVTSEDAVFVVADAAVKGSKKILLLVCGGDPSVEMYVPASVTKKGVSPWHACKRGTYDFGECSFYRISE